MGVGKKNPKTAARTAFDLAVKKGVPDSLIHQLYRSGALNLGLGIWDEWEFVFFGSPLVSGVCIYVHEYIYIYYRTQMTLVLVCFQRSTFKNRGRIGTPGICIFLYALLPSNGGK